MTYTKVHLIDWIDGPFKKYDGNSGWLTGLSATTPTVNTTIVKKINSSLNVQKDTSNYYGLLDLYLDNTITLPRGSKLKIYMYVKPGHNIDRVQIGLGSGSYLQTTSWMKLSDILDPNEGWVNWSISGFNTTKKFNYVRFGFSLGPGNEKVLIKEGELVLDYYRYTTEEEYSATGSPHGGKFAKSKWGRVLTPTKKINKALENG